MERMIYQFQVFQQTTDSLLINVVLDNDMEGGEFEKLYQKLFEEEWKEEFKWKFQYSNEVQVETLETDKSFVPYIDLSALPVPTKHPAIYCFHPASSTDHFFSRVLIPAWS